MGRSVVATLALALLLSSPLARAQEASPPPTSPPPTSPPPSGSAPAAADPERQKLEEEKQALAKEREKLEEERRKLEQERRDLAARAKQAQDEEKDDEDEDEDEKEEKEEKKEGKGPNLAAIGTVATAATGLVSSVGVVVASLLSVPNPLLYGAHRAELEIAQRNYAIAPNVEDVRMAQEARANVTAIETGLGNQLGVLIGAGATLVPAAVSLGIGISQLVGE